MILEPCRSLSLSALAQDCCKCDLPRESQQFFEQNGLSDSLAWSIHMMLVNILEAAGELLEAKAVMDPGYNDGRLVLFVAVVPWTDSGGRGR